MTSPTSDSGSPPWGYFPAEKYLLQHWNHTTSEDMAGQYRRLIRTFLDSGELVNTMGTTNPNESEQQKVDPSEEQIKSILKPWRSEKLRRIAWGLTNERNDQVVILRTYYSGSAADDELMQKIFEDDRDLDSDFEPDTEWWRILDDQTHFDFGSDHWENVLDILPELTIRGLGQKSNITPQTLENAVVSMEKFSFEPHEYVQHWAVVGADPIALADKETFSTSAAQLKLLFLDANGNVVRSARVDTQTLGTYRMSAFGASVYDMSAWEESDLGDKYRPDGVLGRLLYPRKKDAAAAAAAASRIEMESLSLR